MTIVRAEIERLIGVAQTATGSGLPGGSGVYGDNLIAIAAALTQLLAEVGAARAESARLQAMVDQLVTARDVARVEVERLQSLAAIGDLTIQVRDLDELCMDHVSNDDEVGADAEGRLVTAVEIRARLIEAYRASKAGR